MQHNVGKLPEFTHASSRKSARSYLKLENTGAKKKPLKMIAYKLEKKVLLLSDNWNSISLPQNGSFWILKY